MLQLLKDTFKTLAAAQIKHAAPRHEKKKSSGDRRFLSLLMVTSRQCVFACNSAQPPNRPHFLLCESQCTYNEI